MLFCKFFQKLLTAESVSEVCAVQLVKGGEVDELISNHDEIRVFLLADDANGSNHQIAQL
jgi:hypothetical protein